MKSREPRIEFLLLTLVTTSVILITLLCPSRIIMRFRALLPVVHVFKHHLKDGLQRGVFASSLAAGHSKIVVSTFVTLQDLIC